jgi:hypothetical protein
LGASQSCQSQISGFLFVHFEEPVQQNIPQGRRQQWQWCIYAPNNSSGRLTGLNQAFLLEGYCLIRIQGGKYQKLIER